MPTDVSTFASTDTTMRYKEPYVTEGLNKKLLGLLPHGVYRGFELEVDGGAGERTVQLGVDTAESDSLALVNTSAGFSLTVRTTSDVLVDLSGYTDVVVVVTLWGSYAVGATTTVTVRAFTLAEFDALSAAALAELVVCGTVTVPASGVISAGSIVDDRRVWAFARTAPGALRWPNIQPNPYFEAADVGVSVSNETVYAAPGWVLDTTDATLAVSVEATSPAKGTNSLEFALNTAGTPTGVATVTGLGRVSVVPTRRIRVKFQYRRLATKTAGTATLDVDLLFWNAAGTPSAVSILAIATAGFGATDAGYVTVDRIVDVPASVIIGASLRIQLDQTSATWSAAPSLRFDDFVVEVEPADGEGALEALTQPIGGQVLSTLEFLRAAHGDAALDRIVAVAQTLAWGDGGGDTEAVNFLRSRLDEGDVSQAVLGAEGLMLGRATATGTRATANDPLPLITLAAHTALTTNYKLLLETNLGSSSSRGRLYVNRHGNLVFTSNCFWNGTNWDNDNDGGSFKLTFGSPEDSGGAPAGEGAGDIQVTLQSHSLTTGSVWADTDSASTWNSRIDLGSLRLVGSWLRLGSQYNPTTGIALPIGATIDGMMVKGWAEIAATGSGPSITHSQGVASVATSGTTLTITHDDVRKDAVYAVMVTDITQANKYQSVWNRGLQTTALTAFDTIDMATGSAVTWATITHTVLVVIFGEV